MTTTTQTPCGGWDSCPNPEHQHETPTPVTNDMLMQAIRDLRESTRGLLYDLRDELDSHAARLDALEAQR